MSPATPIGAQNISLPVAMNALFGQPLFADMFSVCLFESKQRKLAQMAAVEDFCKLGGPALPKLHTYPMTDHRGNIFSVGFDEGDEW